MSDIHIKRAAKNLGTTVRYLRERCERGEIPCAVRRYRWEGEWLRLRWHIPAWYTLPGQGSRRDVELRAAA